MTTVDDTSLAAVERHVVMALAERLQIHFHDRFVGLWLYGSRARGEPRRRLSDVDLMVVLEKAGDDDQRVAQRLALDAAMAADFWENDISVRVRDRAWLAERRSIDAFFLQELDRDRVVIAGGIA